MQTGGLRDSDGTEGGDPSSDKENSEEWMLVQFQILAPSFTVCLWQITCLLNLNVLIS